MDVLNAYKVVELIHFLNLKDFPNLADDGRSNI
jgi:hypothetical protein